MATTKSTKKINIGFSPEFYEEAREVAKKLKVALPDLLSFLLEGRLNLVCL